MLDNLNAALARISTPQFDAVARAQMKNKNMTPMATATKGSVIWVILRAGEKITSPRFYIARADGSLIWEKDFWGIGSVGYMLASKGFETDGIAAADPDYERSVSKLKVQLEEGKAHLAEKARKEREADGPAS